MRRGRDRKEVGMGPKNLPPPSFHGRRTEIEISCSFSSLPPSCGNQKTFLPSVIEANFWVKYLFCFATSKSSRCSKDRCFVSVNYLLFKQGPRCIARENKRGVPFPPCNLCTYVQGLSIEAILSPLQGCPVRKIQS